MSSLLFVIFLILMAATATFYFAPGLVAHGNPIAADICTIGRTFCRQPEYVAIAAGGTGIVWLILRIAGW